MRIADRCAALSPPMRRQVALLALPLMLLIVWLTVLLPVRQAWQAQQRWRYETKLLLSEAGRAPSLRGALEQQLAAVRSSQLRAKFYPSGGAMSPAALLQGDIDHLMTAAQASSRTLAPIPVSEDVLLLRYGVRVSASLRIDQLQNLLNRLAHHQRLLRVEQVTVVAPQMQQPTDNPPLAISMEIYGYAMAPDVAPATVTVAAARGDAP